MNEWKQWRNCSRSTYLDRCLEVDRAMPYWRRMPVDPYPALWLDVFRLADTTRHSTLRTAYDAGLLPTLKIPWLFDGRTIRPSTWLQALRAHMRGHLALSWLLPRRVECKLKRCRFGLRFAPQPEPKAIMQEAFERQALLLGRLMTEAPLVFEGMIVPVTPPLERAEGWMPYDGPVWQPKRGTNGTT